MPALIAMVLTLSPRPAAAGFLDFLFGGLTGNPPASDSSTSSPAPQIAVGGGRYAVYCVRTCDGRYFPITVRGASAAQTCQAFCPASATKVFSGTGIGYAVTTTGERYPDMVNAFAYRKALKADCTCNGRDPGGLAPVDLSLDTTLRPGDVVATNDGLVAYTGVHVGNDHTAEFTPVSSYPGLSPEVRARLGEMKVAPVSAHVSDNRSVVEPDVTGTLGDSDVSPSSIIPKTSAPKAKRAALD
jgi:hypothetical protein